MKTRNDRLLGFVALSTKGTKERTNKAQMTMKMAAAAVMVMIVVCSTALRAQAISQAYKVYLDPKASVSERVNDLLNRMTLEEKVDQMNMSGLSDVVSSPRMWGVCESQFVGIDSLARLSARCKQAAREKTRLGIPPIQVAECLHGLLAYGATIFPQAIAQGSTWNPALIREMGEAIAREASAVGVDQALSPLFDLIHDARYGRCEECFSEDPYLVGQMGKAFVMGMQGDLQQSLPVMKSGKVMCTAKHFAAYSIPNAGLNLSPNPIGERDLRTYFLSPFEVAVREAGIASVMPSYGEIDGIPAHGSEFLLRRVLRQEWQFQGYVFSDYGGLPFMGDMLHRMTNDKAEMAVRGINAGVDLEAARPDVYAHLAEYVRDGRIDEALVDSVVRCILRAKFRAGVFEKPLPDASRLGNYVHTPAHVNLARRIAEESVVLLKNDGGLLPLNREALRRIAVVGPNANQVEYGDYSCTRDNATGVTLLRGIRELVGSGVEVRYAAGCGIASLDRDGFEEALEAVRQSDVAVVALGESSSILSGIGWGRGPGEEESDQPFVDGEGCDVTDINPFGVQRELLQAICATGTPVVLVLIHIHGRPWSIDWEKAHVPAILEAWYPGEQGGTALARILFGEVDPSGRLNCSFPQSVGHIPCFYNNKPSAYGFYHMPGTPEKPGRDYVFSSPDPLFCFGHGLSYTTFEYADMRVANKVFGHEALTVSVLIKNTGSRKGKETVQLYVRDLAASVTTPVMALRRFEKIELSPGESRRVVFSIPYTELGLWNPAMQYVVEPGDFELLIGRSCQDIRCKETVTYRP